jgi:phage shock protein A
MFDELRDAFREAVDNFNRELNRAQSDSASSGHLSGMLSHVDEAEGRLARLKADLAATQADIEAEQREVETLQRRARLARDIDDHETVQLAEEFEAKHLRRLRVMETKAAALEGELELRQAEVDEMRSQLEEAQAAQEFSFESDDLDLRVDPLTEPVRPQIDVEARLADLKRRMQAED